MEISVKWLSSNRLADVSFVDGNTSFRMPMLDAKDRAAFAQMLRGVIEDLGEPLQAEPQQKSEELVEIGQFVDKETGSGTRLIQWTTDGPGFAAGTKVFVRLQRNRQLGNAFASSLTTEQFRHALNYIKSAKDTVTIDSFDKAHGSNGAYIRRQLMPAFVISDASGNLILTDAGHNELST